MVFASLVFLYFFLPLSLGLYFLLPSLKAKNLFLSIASLIFYAWGEPIWVSLLVVSSLMDYVVGRQIEAHRGKAGAKIALTISVVVNLSVLAAFKYTGFFAQCANDWFNAGLTVPSFALPIGISFYTFQTLSYSIDVYRGDVKAERSFLDFLLFVSLFHQLVAGPIVRYSDIAHEIHERSHSLENFAAGMRRFAWGLFKKVFFANTCAVVVSKTLASDFSNLSVAEAWLGLLMFSLQIYFDFSGYSDMAIGMGHACGFHYQENFNAPYAAQSAGNFWRRWHISLGSFFRDYVYIPLGGNRAHQYRNLAIVWALTGLWHGASWNFVLWGLYWGFWITIERLFLKRVLDFLPRLFSHIYLILLAILGWGLFYFVDLSRFGEFLMLGFAQTDAPLWTESATAQFSEYLFFLPLACLFCLPNPKTWQFGFVEKLRERFAFPKSWKMLVSTIVTLGAIVISTALLVGKSYNPFLYFRF